jgi:hypothetical protein
MESVEQNLRDSLHDLVEGKHSPNNINLSFDLLNYIKSRSKDIGEILTIEVELLKGFEEEACRFSKRINQNWPRFEILKESYKIVSEQVQNYSYEDFLKRKSTFITEHDRAKEEEEEGFRLKLMDFKSNLPLRFQEENEKYMLYSLKNMKRNLSFDIYNDKDISEFAVFHSKDVIYDKTYKLELVLFTKKITSLPADELKLEFYKYYVPEEFEKLKYELEKYYEYSDQKRHLSVINFYISKFSDEIDKQSDESIKVCFALFRRELNKLRKEVVSYYGHPYKAPSDPNKLVWTSSFQEFIDFFEPLIDSGFIHFKGRKDKYSIYTILLNNICMIKQPDVTIQYLMLALKINVPIPLKNIEGCKLTWNSGRDKFAIEFRKLIHPELYERSQFLYHEKGSLRAIAKRLHDIFQIENKRHPGTYITEGSFTQSFRKRIFAPNS